MPEVVKVLCLNQASTSLFKRKYSVSKNFRPVVCLLVCGRLGCLVADFCWAVNTFYCN